MTTAMWMSYRSRSDGPETIMKRSTALIAGLELARGHGIDRIRVFSDSALVVNTVNGDWNLQPEHLKDLCVKAGVLVEGFADIKLSWVPREMNLEADTLASRALGRGR
jgi:ribonuclease HI